jgi:adenine-specific DNA-methyltransferase
MQLYTIPSTHALNSAYYKLRLDRAEIELYKSNLSDLFEKVDVKSDEDHLKYLLADFLKDTWYKGSNQINPIAKNDLVIHLGKSPSDPIGVILEIKSPKNLSEMISLERPNVKALHELILYYLRERIDNKNNEIKSLIISNVHEWYIFDANEFDKKIFSNTAIKKLYELKIKDGKLNTFFYEELTAILDAQNDLVISVSYLNLSKIKISGLGNKNNDSKLILPYKLLSPVNLLKKEIPNDSNSLNKEFYNELLHIIGLEEKTDARKLIHRKSPNTRDEGSLLENALNKIDALNRITEIENLPIYGRTYSEQLFNISLELVITWINRILFLKLLESQLIKYHNGNKEYAFLNKETIADFSELNVLFFEVLARTPSERISDIKIKYRHVPYLNSSLFEPTELEKKILVVNNLNQKSSISIYPDTVLKTHQGKRDRNQIDPLHYIFSFLNSYDFSSEVNEIIHEEKKSLINASVLGLIFEKINGYKEGSFFTPGKITTFMCKEALQRVVVQKFNDSELFKDLNFYATDFDQLKDKLDYTDSKIRLLSNQIINSITICDPAVGSGHFLVSALNELIVLKHHLGILSYTDGSIIRGFNINNDNDELNVIDEQNEKIFSYVLNSSNKPIDSLQKLQVALFREKQTLIENCLFGVDINPNSVKICRLRLWIELLKHSYYYKDSEFQSNQEEVLETLPNIDINIKVGNSLINRLPLAASLKESLSHKDVSIKSYYTAVKNYQNAKDKNVKKVIEQDIARIKNDYRTSITKTNKDSIQLEKWEREFYLKYQSSQLFNNSLDENRSVAKIKLDKKITKLREDILKSSKNTIFQNAFEWRIEFPETLNQDGDFVGFDLVIGNPPYGNLIQENEKKFYKDNFLSTQGPFEIYKFFIERSLQLLSPGGMLCFITPNTWTNLSYFKKIRTIISTRYKVEFCSETLYDVFDEATVDTNIYGIKNTLSHDSSFGLIDQDLNYIGFGNLTTVNDDAILSLKVKPEIITQIEKDTFPLGDIVEIWRGMSPYGARSDTRPYNSFQKTDENHRPMLNGGDIGKFQTKWNGEYILYGDWLHRPRQEKIYNLPHILVQRIRNSKLKDRIVATFDDKMYVSSDGLSNIICKKNVLNHNSELKYILGLLNSKVLNYWFSFYYFDVNIKPEQLRQVPIKNAPESIKNIFTSIVDYLLLINNLKDIQINEYVPNNHISKEILDVLDALVYELYFPSAFRDAGLSVAANTHFMFYPIDFDDVNGNVINIHKTYQALRDKDNELRNTLKLMNIKLASLIMQFKTLS